MHHINTTTKIVYTITFPLKKTAHNVAPFGKKCLSLHAKQKYKWCAAWCAVIKLKT